MWDAPFCGKNNRGFNNYCESRGECTKSGKNCVRKRCKYRLIVYFVVIYTKSITGNNFLFVDENDE